MSFVIEMHFFFVVETAMQFALFPVSKGTVQPQGLRYMFFLWPVVTFISLDFFDAGCRVLEISAAGMSAFSHR